MKRITVNILTPGRFHVLDLARELDSLDFDVKFYSFLPYKNCKQFGLPKKCNVSLFIPCGPLEILNRFFTKLFRKRFYFRKIIQDVLTGVIMRRADVTIAMSGEFVYALKKAKKNGSIIILERGSKHILEQKSILDEIDGAKKVSEIDVKRELEGYAVSDYISVPSIHAKDSFLIHGFSEKTFFINPYGVDLSMFHMNNSVEKKYDVIMVGNWSYQKGCDVIVEAFKGTDLSFLHVGKIGDIVFPECKNMVHIDAVNQKELSKYYNQAKIMLLPSRQDGFGMVLLQAVACGLVVVASKDSGGPDIKKALHNSGRVIILDDVSPESMLKSVEIALQQSIGDVQIDDTDYNQFKDYFSWQAYGKRYADFLREIVIN